MDSWKGSVLHRGAEVVYAKILIEGMLLFCLFLI